MHANHSLDRAVNKLWFLEEGDTRWWFAAPPVILTLDMMY